jgi:hypothetical protein
MRFLRPRERWGGTERAERVWPSLRDRGQLRYAKRFDNRSRIGSGRGSFQGTLL